MRVIGQEAIADMFGVAPKTIVEWQEQGLPIALRGRPGVPSEYESEACITWYVQREVDKTQGETPRDRLARLQSEEIELRLLEKRGVLVQADKVEPMWNAMVGSARAFLRSETNRLAQLLQHTEGVEAKRDLISETLDEFLHKLAGYDPGDDTADAAPGAAFDAAPLPGAPGATATHHGGAVG